MKHSLMVVKSLYPKNSWSIQVDEQDVHAGRVLVARSGITVMARWSYDAPDWTCIEGVQPGESPDADGFGFTVGWFDILETCHRRVWALFSVPAGNDGWYRFDG